MHDVRVVVGVEEHQLVHTIRMDVKLNRPAGRVGNHFRDLRGEDWVFLAHGEQDGFGVVRQRDSWIEAQQ